MRLDNCTLCHSNNVEQIIYDGYFEFEGKRYPLKTKFTKCKKCSAEFLSKTQIKENQEYLYSVKLKEEPILANWCIFVSAKN